MHASRRNNTETASKFVVQIKSAIMLSDKGIYIETRQRSLWSHAVPDGSEPLHTMGAHTEALCLTADSSSSSDEDETYEGSPATTSESLRIASDSCSIVYVCVKRNIQKI